MTNLAIWAGWTGWWALYTHDMAHRHVLIGYAFVWAVQLGYLGFVLQRSSKNAGGQSQQSK